MIASKQFIGKGIYLVVDPSMPKHILMEKLQLILTEKIAAVQIWDNFSKGQDILSLINELCELCHLSDTPLIINNRWEYLKDTALNGVHFDHVPDDYELIKSHINRPFLSGLTCSNELSLIKWAEENKLDYISFCSMFPSATATSCELINYETVRQAKTIFSNPIFLAGGIKPENIGELTGLGCDGIAVVSGIMSSEHPVESIRQYHQKQKL